MNKRTIFSATTVLALSLLAVAVLPMAAHAQGTPTLTSISPTSAPAGSGSTTVTLQGSNFESNSVVNVNASPRSTTFVSPTQLTITLTPSDLANTNSYTLTVTNPGTGGGTSTAQTFLVTSGTTSMPTISSISPSSAVQGGAAFTLTVNGNNFTPNSVVNVNGAARTTTYVSATQLTAAIPASDLNTAGTNNITVTTPGVGTSGAVTFTTTASSTSTLMITSLSPSVKAMNDASFTLTVNGTGFTSGAIVYFNGSPRTTNFISANQLTATIPASDLLIAGNYPITVVSSGTTSNSLLLSVVNTSRTTVVPQLPNTGFSPDNTGTGLVAVAGAIVALLAISIGAAIGLKRLV